MSVGILIGIWLVLGAAFGFERLRDRAATLSITRYAKRYEALAHAERSIPTDEPISYQNGDVAVDHSQRVSIDESWAEFDAMLSSEWDQPLAAPAPRAASPRAAAYAHLPVEAPVVRAPVVAPSRGYDDQSPTPMRRERLSFNSREMRRRRLTTLKALGGSMGVTTIGALLTNWGFFTFLSVVSWLLLLGYAGLIVQAVLQMEDRPVATRPTLRLVEADEVADDDEFYEAGDADLWTAAPRRAAGF